MKQKTELEIINKLTKRLVRRNDMKNKRRFIMNKLFGKRWKQKVSEIVGQGHPDLIADEIANIITQESIYSATEALINRNGCYLTGETKLRKGNRARQKINVVLRKLSKLYGQTSPIITMNFVTQDEDLSERRENQTSGDQEVVFFHKLNKKDVHFYLKKIKNEIDILYPYYDYKILVNTVTMKANVSMSSTHPDHKKVFTMIIDRIRKYFNIYDIDLCVFKGGSIFNDTGVTGRKIVMEREGCGYPHGGGAIFGKDKTKSAVALMNQAEKYSKKHKNCDVVGVYHPRDEFDKPTLLKKI